jgi:hypothetical protein
MILAYGIITLLAAVGIFFAGKILSLSLRERIAFASFVAGCYSMCVGAFLISPEVGFFVLSAALIGSGLLLGFTNGN